MKLVSRVICIALATTTFGVQCISPIPSSLFNSKTSSTSIIVAQAAENTSGDYIYIISENKVTITGYIGKKLDITIPEKIDNKQVCKIGENAFSESPIKSVDIPSSVTNRRIV